jgi:uncharacterized membrane protein YesL
VRFEKILKAMDALATALVVNLLLVVTASPLIVLLVFTNAFETWLLVALAAVVATPGLTAAFTAFGDADGRPFRAFLSGYRATWTRAARLGVGLVAACAVVVVDAKFFADGPYAQAAMVVLAVVAVLVAGTVLIALTAIAEDPTIRLRDALRRAVWSSLRYWYLTLASLAVLVVFAVLFVNVPLLAISAGASPILYVAWANSRFSLRAAPAAPVAADPAH